jgi:hypothetical protein
MAHRLLFDAGMRVRIVELAILGFGVVACSAAHAPRTVKLLASAGIPYTDTPADATPLEVVTRSTAVRDPMPVEGSDVAYSDMEAALGFAVSSATVPWASQHKKDRPDGWQLFVEITQADAQYSSEHRLVISFAVRATLRARTGHVYLAQTHAACRQGGVIDLDRGGAVVYACMTRIGRDLADWLGGIEG